MEDLQKRIGYTFKNTDLLTEALTHSSYANEHKAKHIKYNERLEFLGDAVLSIVVSDYIFKLCQFAFGKFGTMLKNIIGNNN